MHDRPPTELLEQHDLVTVSGVDLVQGYFVSKPMAAEAVPGWAAKWDKNPG